MTSDTARPLDPQVASAWLRRWDAQQERYVADRERRFDVICDTLCHALAGCDRPLVLDLGCGPGSLTARVCRRLPSARAMGVDNDPLLLALARSVYGHTAQFAEADLRRPGWSALTGLNSAVDAAISSTALHYLPAETLADLYLELADVIRPGGLFINADNLYDEQPMIAGIAAALRRSRVASGEDWAAWWQAATRDRELAGLVAERERSGAGDGDHRVSAAVHEQLLRRAGFDQVGTVWQAGDDVVLVAVRRQTVKH
ncbi:class I SAM-dependent methyltransferase [Nonomuraea sp. NPDC059194]|uniref:class I SAM-dependent methyltransferase n=1 Tax=Nonomuraea sp. NPDC059194 TaxID=3346764 RepID=UPI0036888ADA